MKKTTFLIPMVLSLFVSYYLYKNNSESSVAYFLDLAFKEAPICIAFYKKDSISDGNNGKSLLYSNRKTPKNFSSSAIFNEMEDCLDIILMNGHGSSAFYSLSEPAIVDAYINGDIELVFSKDVALFEKQILTLHQMVYDGLFTFGWAVEKLLHVYNHWIAQYVNSYRISYDWIDLHYTDSDDIIAAFLDDKYLMYSHGIGFGPSLPRNKDNRYVNTSRLAFDITMEESATNKLQYIVDECNLGSGSKVLDIGGGFGAFARFAVPLGIHVHALTLSTSSFDRLQSLSKKLSDECECEDGKNKTASTNKCVCGSLTVSLKNFWELRNTELGKSMAGTLDTMICSGSIEHLPYYERLMESAEYYLKPGGYLHVDGFGSKIGFSSNYFLQKYVFPGDSAPLLISSYFKAWENSNLLMVGVHFDNENYSNTWYHWSRKFERVMRNESHPVTKKVSKMSVKIFRLYLWGFVMSYEHPTSPVHAWRVDLQKPLF